MQKRKFSFNFLLSWLWLNFCKKKIPISSVQSFPLFNNQHNLKNPTLKDCGLTYYLLSLFIPIPVVQMRLLFVPSEHFEFCAISQIAQNFVPCLKLFRILCHISNCSKLKHEIIFPPSKGLLVSTGWFVSKPRGFEEKSSNLWIRKKNCAKTTHGSKPSMQHIYRFLRRPNPKYGRFVHNPLLY